MHYLVTHLAIAQPETKTSKREKKLLLFFFSLLFLLAIVSIFIVKSRALLFIFDILFM